ncbi:glutamate ABC transporter substrate-binding protein [Vallicoccus soli]|uniref:Glutamate ABC transporter substrate-binding protein n=1 Tax=Vallicoccus soli TaxID=2339232 RepID=A0A3A3Z061_9ACTN|nr:glutamate ABC transporter substrate-binding protein [Vallicoccus soli]RJK96471.1 glutamate ABC transporter substrate-binding protein [Vallicoccus soli]
MLRRTTPALAAAAALALALSACGGDDEGDGGTAAPAPEEDVSFEAGTTMAELNEAGSITVGTKFDQPLFGLANLEGEPEGFDVEIAKLIASKLGIGEDGIEWVESVSANREPFLQQGRVDMVVATYTINDERDQVIDFAGPYYVAGQDILVPEGNPEGVQGPEDLAGLNVCSVSGSTPASNIQENYPEAELTLFDAYTDCRDALQNGQVDAVTTDNVILSGYVSQAEDEFDLVDAPFTEEPYGIGIPQGDTAFCEFINETLQEAYDDGTWAEIFESTVGEVIEETPEPPTLNDCGGGAATPAETPAS